MRKILYFDFWSFHNEFNMPQLFSIKLTISRYKLITWLINTINKNYKLIEKTFKLKSKVEIITNQCKMFVKNRNFFVSNFPSSISFNGISLRSPFKSSTSFLHTILTLLKCVFKYKFLYQFN